MTDKLEKTFQAAMKATTAIPTQAQYEARELQVARAKELEVNSASLSDRKQAQTEFLDAMANDPELVGERIGWLLDGNYGYGPMMLAKQALANKRANHKAILTHMIGIHEWMCPVVMGIAAWKKLSPAQKKKLDHEVEKAIKSASHE